jgi:hypothetical protein
MGRPAERPDSLADKEDKRKYLGISKSGRDGSGKDGEEKESY